MGRAYDREMDRPFFVSFCSSSSVSRSTPPKADNVEYSYQSTIKTNTATTATSRRASIVSLVSSSGPGGKLLTFTSFRAAASDDKQQQHRPILILFGAQTAAAMPRFYTTTTAVAANVCGSPFYWQLSDFTRFFPLLHPSSRGIITIDYY